ncbi:MAG: tetratricopeptide repeat protein [Fibrobacteria bacterium]|nr:tetratricopeptide repeat protein [Fibrobacteria bacterium]
MNHLIILASILFCFCISCTTQDLELADEFLSMGDFFQARKLYKKVIEHSPRNFQARFGTALSYYQEAAYKTKQKTVTKEDWENAVYHLKLASHINETANLKKNLAGAYYNLGVYYKQNQQFTASLSQFQRAVVFDTTLYEAYNQLGALYHQKGEYKKSEIAYIRSLHIKPNYAVAYFNLGSLYWTMKNFEKVINSWDKAVYLDRNNSHYQEWLRKAKAKTRAR